MAKRDAALDHAFQALADPTRRAVLRRLAEGPATVGELARPHPMALPTFLKHVRALERGGLVRTEKIGRARSCMLEPARLAEAEEWIARQRAVWEARLDRLDDYLARLQQEEGDDDAGPASR